jgi:hypothetical protein
MSSDFLPGRVPLPQDKLRAHHKPIRDRIRATLSHPVCGFAFGIAVTALFGVSLSGGDTMGLVVPALAFGFIAAAIGWTWAPDLSKTAKFIWIVVSLIVFISDGAAAIPSLRAMIISWSPVRLASKFDTYEPFAGARNRNQSLGEPLSREILVDGAYLASYEHGLVLWLSFNNTHYVLPDSQSTKTTGVFPLIEIPTATSPFYDDSAVRKILHIPGNKRPPSGGVAFEWSKNPDQWSWLGERQWQAVVNKEVYVQSFSQGIIVGPLPYSGAQDTGFRLLIISTDHPRWSQESTTLRLSSPINIKP